MDDEQVSRISDALKNSAEAIQGINAKFDIIDEHMKTVEVFNDRMNTKVEGTLGALQRLDETFTGRMEHVLDSVSYFTDELAFGLEGMLASLKRVDVKYQAVQLPKTIIPLVVPILLLVVELAVANAYLGLLLASLPEVRAKKAHLQYLFANAAAVLMGLTASLVWLGAYRFWLHRRGIRKKRQDEENELEQMSSNSGEDKDMQEAVAIAEDMRVRLDIIQKFAMEAQSAREHDVRNLSVLSLENELARRASELSPASALGSVEGEDDERFILDSGGDERPTDEDVLPTRQISPQSAAAESAADPPRSISRRDSNPSQRSSPTCAGSSVLQSHRQHAIAEAVARRRRARRQQGMLAGGGAGWSKADSLSRSAGRKANPKHPEPEAGRMPSSGSAARAQESAGGQHKSDPLGADHARPPQLMTPASSLGDVDWSGDSSSTLPGRGSVAFQDEHPEAPPSRADLDLKPCPLAESPRLEASAGDGGTVPRYTEDASSLADQTAQQTPGATGSSASSASAPRMPGALSPGSTAGMHGLSGVSADEAAIHPEASGKAKRSVKREWSLAGPFAANLRWNTSGDADSGQVRPPDE